ncbi:MAG: hypothetical protein ACRCZS_01720 [Chroococcidiopsis sp.]
MQKTIQHYRLNLEQAKRDYQDGLITATGLVYYTLAILKPPGQKLRVKNIARFAEDLGIGEATFYRVVSKLKLRGLIAWESIDGLNLWISTNEGVVNIPHSEVPKNGEGFKSLAALSLSQIVESDSQIVESDSQIVESDSQIVESDSQIVEFQSSKPAFGKGSGNPTNTLTNLLQIFYKSLSNSEREKFEKFVDRKIEALPYKIALKQKWIAKNLEELEGEFRETVGNRRSINLPNSEQIARLQQMKDAGEIRCFGLEPYKKAQTIVVDDFCESLPWWEFFNTR